MQIQVYVGTPIILAMVFSVFAGAIYARQPKARLNRVFTILCAAMAMMSLSQTMLAITRDTAEAQFWIKIGMAIWPFSMTTMLAFSLVYAEAHALLKHKALIGALYLITLAISILCLAMPFPVDLYFEGTWQYRNRSPSASPVLMVTAVWGTVISLATAIILIRHRRRMRERVMRRQATFVTLGILLPVLLGILTQAVLPGLGIRIPAFADVSGAGLVFFVGFAIWRCELFVLDPVQAADQILSVMHEAVLLMDVEGTVRYANPAARRIWERPRDDLAGKAVEEVCGPGFAEAGGMRKLLGDGHESTMEISWNAADGSSATGLVSGTFLRDRAGDLTGSLLVATDISSQKRLEGLLQQSRQTLRILVDNIQAKVVLVDRHGNIQVANDPVAQHFAHTPSSLLGRNVFSLFPDAIAKDRRERLAQVMASGVPMHYEEIRDERHWEHRLAPVTDGEGRVTSVSVLSLDVTERVEAERMRERLIGELSDALAKVKTLSGLIPICSHCKRIRNDAGYWQQVEQYLSEHTDADFTHGLCRDCFRKLYPDIAKEVEEEEPV